MDNLSHSFGYKLGVSLLATVLILGTFSITSIWFEENDSSQKQGIVKGVSTSNQLHVAMVDRQNGQGQDLEVQPLQAGEQMQIAKLNKTTLTRQPLAEKNLPDLKPIKLLIRKADQTDDSRFEAGDQLTIRVAVKNIGRASSTETDFSVRWGADIQHNDILPALEPGEVFDTTFDLTWATGTDALFRFALKADSSETVEELKEFNNTLVRKIRFHFRRCLAASDSLGETATGTDELSVGPRCIDWLEDQGEDADEASDEVLDDEIPEFLEDVSDERKENILKLRARIRNLERKIGQAERELILREKQLTQSINRALAQRLKGKILLQVEGNGEAWYVDETTEERFYLKDGEAAYEALKAFGLGISNEDLESLPVGIEERAELADSDGDGLDDQLEEALNTDPNDNDSDNDGYNDGDEVKNDFDPLGQRIKQYRRDLTERLEGKILIQVEGNGEAWYVHNGRRYYMKDGPLAYQIMRYLSLGIANDDLRQIPVGELE